MEDKKTVRVTIAGPADSGRSELATTVAETFQMLHRGHDLWIDVRGGEGNNYCSGDPRDADRELIVDVVEVTTARPGWGRTWERASAEGSVERFKVPGGWIVAVVDGDGVGSGPPVFVPEPEPSPEIPPWMSIERRSDGVIHLRDVRNDLIVATQQSDGELEWWGRETTCSCFTASGPDESCRVCKGRGSVDKDVLIHDLRNRLGVAELQLAERGELLNATDKCAATAIAGKMTEAEGQVLRSVFELAEFYTGLHEVLDKACVRNDRWSVRARIDALIRDRDLLNGLLHKAGDAELRVRVDLVEARKALADAERCRDLYAEALTELGIPDFDTVEERCAALILRDTVSMDEHWRPLLRDHRRIFEDGDTWLVSWLPIRGEGGES